MVLKFLVAPCCHPEGHGSTTNSALQNPPPPRRRRRRRPFTSSPKRPFASVSDYYVRLPMASLHCDADTGGGIVALCSWAAHVLRNDASLSLPLAAACSDGSWSRCLEYLQTGRMCQPYPARPHLFPSTLSASDLSTHRSVTDTHLCSPPLEAPQSPLLRRQQSHLSAI